MTIWESFNFYNDEHEEFGEKGKVYHYLSSINMYEESSAKIAGEVHFMSALNMYQESRIQNRHITFSGFTFPSRGVSH